jgi:hypothetical protein
MQPARNREGILEFSDFEPRAIQSLKVSQAEGGKFSNENDLEVFDDTDAERTSRGSGRTIRWGYMTCSHEGRNERSCNAPSVVEVNVASRE